MIIDDSWQLIEHDVFRLFDALALEGEHTAIAPHLAKLGWSQFESEYPVAACELLFRAQGRSLAQTDCLDRVMIAELAARLSEPADAVVLPDLSCGDTPGSDNGLVSGITLGPAFGRLVVPVRGPLGTVSIGVVDRSRLQITPMNTVDPSVNWSQVSGPLPNDLTEATFEWNLAVGAAHRAMATELIALTDEALRITLHAAETQAQTCAPEFSPPLSDAFADLEAARRVLADSWRFGGLLSGQVAKAISGRAHRKMCDAAEEICGAVGDAPSDLHRYVARGLQLLAADRLFDECAPPSALDTTVGLGSPNPRAKVP